MTIFFTSRVIFFSLSVVFALACPAWATDQSDLSVALKTLPLLENKMTGPTIASVVYDPKAPDTKVDAEGIKSIIDGGLKAPGDINLTVQMVSTPELPKLSGSRIIFWAHGIPPEDYDNIGAASASAGALTICTDLDSVRRDKCVLGIVSNPGVEIFYSPVAAENAKISFSPAFTMLARRM